MKSWFTKNPNYVFMKLNQNSLISNLFFYINKTNKIKSFSLIWFRIWFGIYMQAQKSTESSTSSTLAAIQWERQKHAQMFEYFGVFVCFLSLTLLIK